MTERALGRVGWAVGTGHWMLRTAFEEGGPPAWHTVFIAFMSVCVLVDVLIELIERADAGPAAPAPAPPAPAPAPPAWMCKWARVAVAGRKAARWRVRRLRRGRFGMRAGAR